MTVALMPATSDTPQVLGYAATEAEAAIIIAKLGGAGIDAEAEGVLTSALRAEAPGEVRILVQAGDQDRARQLMADYWTNAQHCTSAHIHAHLTRRVVAWIIGLTLLPILVFLLLQLLGALSLSMTD